MDDQLLGYLLNALESDESRQVEERLRTDAGARERLQKLQYATEPLGADIESGPPPAGLWVRTLARVAELQCQRLPAIPATAMMRPTLARGWWRRADVLVAASLLLCLTLFVPPGINLARHQYQIVACKDNLRNFHGALARYSDAHQGEFPNVASAGFGSKQVAGMFVPVLRDAGLLGDQVTVTCPTNVRKLPLRHTLHQLQSMPDHEFDELKPRLAGCYAYPLGYVENGITRGPRMETDGSNASVPIMADRPPDGVEDGLVSNSPNHNGWGQNVLYQDGHVAFVKNRNAGFDADDIYVNRDAKVAASKDRRDAVLGRSAARP